MSHAVLNTSKYIKKEKFFYLQSNSMHLVGILFLLSILSTIFIIGWIVLDWMEDVQRLPLSKLELIGKRQYTIEDDIRQSILNMNSLGTFITQDVNLIKNQIERLPWIKQANVKKQWPNELKISLVEYVPIASWNGLHMIDINGNVFNVPNERIKRRDLPNLYGPECSNHKVIQGFLKMVQIFDKNCFALKDLAIKDVVMTARHSWQITLTNNIKLNLGRKDTVKRLLRFIELYPLLQQKAQINNKRINYVDLRYNSGAAVG